MCTKTSPQWFKGRNIYWKQMSHWSIFKWQLDTGFSASNCFDPSSWGASCGSNNSIVLHIPTWRGKPLYLFLLIRPGSQPLPLPPTFSPQYGVPITLLSGPAAAPPANPSHSRVHSRVWKHVQLYIIQKNYKSPITSAVLGMSYSTRAPKIITRWWYLKLEP